MPELRAVLGTRVANLPRRCPIVVERPPLAVATSPKSNVVFSVFAFDWSALAAASPLAGSPAYAISMIRVLAVIAERIGDPI